jgi:hypothetical protein
MQPDHIISTDWTVADVEEFKWVYLAIHDFLQFPVITEQTEIYKQKKRLDPMLSPLCFVVDTICAGVPFALSQCSWRYSMASHCDGCCLRLKLQLTLARWILCGQCLFRSGRSCFPRSRYRWMTAFCLTMKDLCEKYIVTVISVNTEIK